MSQNVATAPGSVSIRIDDIKAMPVLGPVAPPITAEHGTMTTTNPGFPAQYVMINVNLHGGIEPKPCEVFRLTYKQEPGTGEQSVMATFIRKDGENLSFTRNL